jgi:L-malate glycosyltransferase
MRIAVLLNSGVGGSGVVATDLACRMAEDGHEVHLIASSVPFRLDDAKAAVVFFHRVESMTYPLFDTPLTTLSSAGKLVEVIEAHNIDVVHAHYAVPHASVAIMARQMLRGVKRPGLVTTLHGTDVTLVGLDRAYLRTTQWSIENSDVVTAVSRHLAETTVRDMAVRRSDIHVVPNAVDSHRFRPRSSPTARRRFAGDDEKIILHASNFRQVKRVDDVVRMFAAVASSCPSRLIMVGEGPERTRAIDLSRDLGIADRVWFVGSVPHIENYLAIADLFVLPSSQESFGLSALEAMASGVPVIATKIGGIPEVVEDGVTGLLHELGDVRSMAESACTLLRDADLYGRFSVAARKHAVDRFDDRAIAQRYESLYRQAVEYVAATADTS